MVIVQIPQLSSVSERSRKGAQVGHLKAARRSLAMRADGEQPSPRPPYLVRSGRDRGPDRSRGCVGGARLPILAANGSHERTMTAAEIDAVRLSLSVALRSVIVSLPIAIAVAWTL